MNLDPSKDGIDHINIYSKGRTSLGLFLSNFTECDLVTEDGEFSSIEGYWYWLLSPVYGKGDCVECEGSGDVAFALCQACNRDSLRTLYGYEAKKVGRAICGQDYPKEKDQVFIDKIKKAIQFKIENSGRKSDFIKSKLPFAHYYVYGDKVTVPTSGKWIIEYIEQLRKEYGEMSALQKR